VKILTRYILKESFIFFSVSLFAFIGILLTVRMLRFLSMVINRGVDIMQIVSVFISIIPMFLEIAIPMSTLLGIMLAIARLSGDSEIVVIRASGVGLHQLMKPVVIFGLVAFLINLCICIYLGPLAFENLQRTLFEIARTKSTAGLNPGIFNKLGGLTIYAEKIDHQSGAIDKVLVDDKRNKENRKVVLAQNGTITSDEQTRTITLKLVTGDIHEMVDNKYVLTHFDTNNLVIGSEELYDEEDNKKGKSAREMYMFELDNNISEFTRILNEKRSQEQDQRSEREKKIAELGEMAGLPRSQRELTTAEMEKKLSKMKIEQSRRFAMPFAAFVMAMMALPLGVQPPRAQRAWGSSISLSLGLLVFVCYYGMISIGVALGEGGKINPYIALWIPNVVASLIAGYILRQVCSERWSSISQGFEVLLNRAMGIFSKKRTEA
jgi:lipopolysaccharide export system permease protein